MLQRLRSHLPFWGAGSRTFNFLDSGPLIDNDLELVAPSRQWLNSVLAISQHPQTIEQAPDLAQISRDQLLEFIDSCPNGHQAAGASRAAVPTYHFWMRVSDGLQSGIAGGIGLRVGDTFEIVMYLGHIGYHVYPSFRGRHLAERACRLVAPLAKAHGLNPVWITCNPDNHASRRTCERLGAQFVEVVPVPIEHSLRRRGETAKCRYRLDV